MFSGIRTGADRCSGASSRRCRRRRCSGRRQSAEGSRKDALIERDGSAERPAGAEFAAAGRRSSPPRRAGRKRSSAARELGTAKATASAVTPAATARARSTRRRRRRRTRRVSTAPGEGWSLRSVQVRREVAELELQVGHCSSFSQALECPMSPRLDRSEAGSRARRRSPPPRARGSSGRRARPGRRRGMPLDGGQEPLPLLGRRAPAASGSSAGAPG